MIQCQGCTCAGWLWEGEGGLGDHLPGVYVPLKALFLVFSAFSSENFDIFLIFAQNIDCGYKNKKNRYTPAYPSFTV